jgi:hypothetical protein
MAKPKKSSWNNEWMVIGRGFNGFHAKGVNVSSSGASSVEEYIGNAVEGALVYDAAHLEDNAEGARAFIALIMGGPMVDCRLPPSGERRFGEEDRAAAKRMAPGLEGAYQTLAERAQDPAYGGLDSVGVGIYEALLCAVPGIKIGHVRGGEVVWNP